MGSVFVMVRALMMQKGKKMDDIVRSLNYTLDCSSQRLKWYMDTGNEKYLTDCEMYLRVANIYMTEINKGKKDESN
jgi:hypothetical protein